MKNPILLSFFCCLVSVQAFSQQRRGMEPNVIAGEVIDASTKTGLEYATISLLKAADSTFIDGTITDETGTYELKSRPGDFLVRVSYMGYNSATQPVTVPRGQGQMISVPEISIAPNQALLKEAVIEADRSQVALSLEKKTFEVGADLSSIGGSATDVLENVPSVTVDTEGNISLRGSSNVRILIDGRQSGMVALSAQDALQMLPADMIERVEVITNPSARYDAEGMAGIINIITKKEKKKGTNATLSLTAGVPQNYQASLNLNHRTGNWNFYGGYGYRNGEFDGFSDEERFTVTNDSASLVFQNQDRTRGRESHSLQAGVEYQLGKYNAFNVNGAWRTSEGNNTNRVDYQFDNDQGTYSTAIRLNTEVEDRVNGDVGINYTRTFAEKKRKLLIDLTYSASDETEDTDAEQFNLSTTGQPEPSTTLYQHTLNEEEVENWVFQADYVDPIGENGTFETGLKSSIRTISSNYMVEERPDPSQDWVILPEVTNGLVYDEEIHAGYLMYSHRWDKLSVAAGIRGEYSIITITQRELDTEDRKEYFDPFPTLHLSYALTKEQSVQLSYSRRISRPGFWSLNPFFSYENPLSFRSGNPNLDPEYTNAIELGYLRFEKKWNINPSIYYRYTTGVIQPIQQVVDGVTITRPENVNNQISYGVEVTGTYRPFKWWNLNGTVNGFGAQLDGSNVADGAVRDFFTWTLQGSSMFKIPKWFNVQVRGNYRADQETAQGKRLSIAFMDVALTKEFWSKKATVSFKVQDVFNSRIRRSESQGSNFDIYSERRWRPRMFVFGFTYRLNPNERDKQQRNRNFEGGGEG